MKLTDVVRLLQAEVYSSAGDLSREVSTVFAGDMLSDVLARAEAPDVLITGLMNPQVIRTAQMMDSTCVVFVRDKRPSALIVTLAEHCDIVVLAADCDMFTACGRLFDGGMRSAQ